MTKKEYYTKRHNIIFNENKTSRRTIKKGKVMKQAHLCSLCGRPLTKYGYSTGKYVSDVKFYVINLPSFVYINLCYDANSCYENHCNNSKELQWV